MSFGGQSGRRLSTRALALALLGVLALPILVACGGREDRVTLEGTLIARDEDAWLVDTTLIGIESATTITGEPQVGARVRVAGRGTVEGVIAERITVGAVADTGLASLLPADEVTGPVEEVDFEKGRLRVNGREVVVPDGVSAPAVDTGDEVTVRGFRLPGDRILASSVAAARPVAAPTATSAPGRSPASTPTATPEPLRSQPTPTATRAPEPEPTSVPTSTPTPSPSPTPRPQPPPTSAPTATPMPVPTVTPRPAATPTPTTAVAPPARRDQPQAPAPTKERDNDNDKKQDDDKKNKQDGDD
ncbi:MAG: hypothetical protein M3Q65_12625 [Chloroflexota bacterium]|nr:hypothetical protein [Chloroflexota bacterium]